MEPAKIIDFTHAGLLAAKATVETGTIHLPARENNFLSVIKGFTLGERVKVLKDGELIAYETVTFIGVKQRMIGVTGGTYFYRHGDTSIWRMAVYLPDDRKKHWGWLTIQH